MNYPRLSRRAAAKRLQITERTIDRWVRVGVCGVRLPRTCFGGRVFFNEADIDAFFFRIEQKKQEIMTLKPTREQREWEEREQKRLGVKVGSGR